jgi:hypothetical protein
MRSQFQIWIKSYIRADASQKPGSLIITFVSPVFCFLTLEAGLLLMKRFPEGVFGDFFYEKDAPAFTPEWVETYSVPKKISHNQPFATF